MRKISVLVLFRVHESFSPDSRKDPDLFVDAVSKGDLSLLELIGKCWWGGTLRVPYEEKMLSSPIPQDDRELIRRMLIRDPNVCLEMVRSGVFRATPTSAIDRKAVFSLVQNSTAASFSPLELLQGAPVGLGLQWAPIFRADLHIAVAAVRQDFRAYQYVADSINRACILQVVGAVACQKREMERRNRR